MDKLNILITHLNIRQSIIILLAKLVTLDIVLAALICIIYILLITGSDILKVIILDPLVFLLFFIVIGIFKISLGIFVVLQWLNEYYEITPEYVIHKQGIIFRKSEQYRLDHIRRINVHDTLLGELFNYATISLYDIRLNNFLNMVLVHNPRRYVHILKELQPAIETERDKTLIPFMPKDEEETELED